MTSFFALFMLLHMFYAFCGLDIFRRKPAFTRKIIIIRASDDAEGESEFIASKDASENEPQDSQYVSPFLLFFLHMSPVIIQKFALKCDFK